MSESAERAGAAPYLAAGEGGAVTGVPGRDDWLAGRGGSGMSSSPAGARSPV